MRELELQGDALILRVVPEFGGKITSLKDVRTGREWLWRNPDLKPRRPIYGESYIEELDSGGWDEIFPTVSPCDVAGLGTLPDHGELIGLPWTVEQHDAGTLRLSVHGRCAPYRFTREIRCDPEGFVFDYQLEHLGQGAFPWLWCAHPLIAIEPGMQIRYGDARWSIPDPESRDFAPSAQKFFTRRGEVCAVSLESHDGARLSMHYDSGQLPYLGFWRNLRGWSGIDSPRYFNLGVEPTTAPVDSLVDGIAAGVERWLEPGQTERWSLELRAGSDAGS